MTRAFIFTMVATATMSCSEKKVAAPQCAAAGPHGAAGAVRTCITYGDPAPGYALHADTAVWRKVGDIVMEGERSLVHFIDRTEKAQAMLLAGPDTWDAERATVAHRDDVIRLGWRAGPIVAMKVLSGRDGYLYRHDGHANGVESTFLAGHFRFSCAPAIQFGIRLHWPKGDATHETAALQLMESVRPTCY